MGSMEIRRASEALLRSRTSPFTSLFSSSTATRWQSARQQWTNTRPFQRQYTNSSSTYPRAAATTSAARDPPQNQTHGSASTTSSTSRESTDDILDRLSRNVWTAPTSSPFPGLTPQIERKLNLGKSSSAELLQQLQKVGPKPSAATLQSSQFDLSRMEGIDLEGVKTDVATTMPVLPKVPLRLNPAAGKMVYVNERTDVTSAIRKMEILVARNSVRRDFQSQRYHERPGMKRKRLRRERWRKNFKESFKATVGRVQELRKQGW